jgi:hypothetical protein
VRAILEPIQALHQRAAYFLAAPELRVLLVEVDSVMRQPAADHLLGLEFSSDNRSLFVRLKTDHRLGEPGWAAWTSEVLAEHEERRAALTQAGVEAASVPEPAADLEPVERFAAAVWSVAQVAQAAPLSLQGVTCVLAPAQVDVDKSLGRSVLDLVRTPSLQCVRWIVVDPTARLRGFLSDLGDGLLTCECRLDAEANERAAAAQMAAAAAAGPKAHPRARQGAAWPRGVRPPSRGGARAPKGAPIPPEVAAIAREGEALAEVTAAVRGAANAARTGDGAEAVRLQARARDVAFTAGLHAQATQMELVLATYQLGLPVDEGGGPAAAKRTFGRAQEGAERQGLHLEAAQAALGLAQLHLLTPNAEQAVHSFRRAADLAKKAGANALVIEALRAGGQTALTAGALSAAAALWREAIAVALGLPGEEAKATSGAEVARLLAAACREYSLVTRAEEFERVAQRLEAGDPMDQTPGPAPPLEEALRRPGTPDIQNGDNMKLGSS